VIVDRTPKNIRMFTNCVMLEIPTGGAVEYENSQLCEHKA
jgi:hypothetical protein